MLSFLSNHPITFGLLSIIICFLIIRKANRKFWKFYFGFFIVCSLGGFLFYLGSITGIFEPKIINEKYLYFFNDDNDTIKYHEVLSSKNMERELDVMNYYNHFNDTNISFAVTNDFFYIPRFIKVGIIKFSNDSSLVKVQAKWEGTGRPYEYDEVGYVPRFTLHDTLPNIK